MKKLVISTGAGISAESGIQTFRDANGLWEKYDAVQGGIGVSTEYETPEMMGWTAGVYVYFDEELKRVGYDKRCKM